MAGPALTIELPKPVPTQALSELRQFLARVSFSLSERRPGDFTASVHADRLGLTATGGVDGRRPFLITLTGPGVGDEEGFAAEHADEDLLPLIGFTPTHAIGVCAMCNRPVDHVATAVLTAAIMDLVGGVAMAELREDQFPVVPGLPGVLATSFDRWPTAYGSATFLRSWAELPGFRLVK